MARHWKYANAETTRVGRMVCTACHKPIETGRFRFRETEDAFLPQHEACCSDDPQWARLDREAARRNRRAEQISRDLTAIMERHGMTASDLLCVAEEMLEEEEA